MVNDHLDTITVDNENKYFRNDLPIIMKSNLLLFEGVEGHLNVDSKAC